MARVMAASFSKSLLVGAAYTHWLRKSLCPVSTLTIGVARGMERRGVLSALFFLIAEAKTLAPQIVLARLFIFFLLPF